MSYSNWGLLIVSALFLFTPEFLSDVFRWYYFNGLTFHSQSQSQKNPAVLSDIASTSTVYDVQT